MIVQKLCREGDSHTLEVLFAGMISRLDLVIDILMILTIFDVFCKPFWGVF